MGEEALRAEGREPRLWNTAAFALLWVGLGSILRVVFRLRIGGAPRREGAYILAPNHVSFLDPLLLGAASHRRITYMMAANVWRSPKMGWFYRFNHTIPVEMARPNRDALRQARRELKAGRVLGVFPEGSISRDGKPLLGSPGAISLALQERVPIVPVGIVGTRDVLPYGASFPRVAGVTVRFGQPIPPEEFEALSSDRKRRLDLAVRLLMDRIAELTGNVSREAELEALAKNP